MVDFELELVLLYLDKTCLPQALLCREDSRSDVTYVGDIYGPDLKGDGILVDHMRVLLHKKDFPRV